LAHAHNIHSVADLDALTATPDPAATPAMDIGLLRQLQLAGTSGAAGILAAAAAELPLDLRCMMASGVLTIEQLGALHEHLGIVTAADLDAALRRRAIHTVPGLDAAIEAAIARTLPTLREGIPRIPLGQAVAITEPLLARLRAMPAVSWAEPAGSLRRGRDTIGDLEIVAPADDPQSMFDELEASAERRLHRGARRLYLSIDRVQVGIRSPLPASGGATLLTLTGSSAHIDRLTDLAAGRGWSLGVDSLARPGGRSVAGTEEEIYAALGLPFIAPEIREGHDEFKAAANGTLPDLITREDIRGDLHMHTDWSDGRDSIDVMVGACVALGYHYLAITDHAEHSAASKNLSRDDVARQADAIAAVRERYPHIVVLHGCEVDILANGSLDLPDAVLQQFDIVLASLHDRGNHGPRELMKRYARAMRHPLVSIITHPTNRVVPRRPGYDLDWDRVIADAVETGTMLEVDGAPSHLDMPGELARRAIQLGATIAIDSDCHRAELLDRQMRMGVSTARRGWVERRHVINTRPIEAVRAAIAAKRSRRS
jgi:DNA polymerase (family 10)